MTTKIIAIAENTFLETIRQPIFGIMLILTCMMMLFNVSLAAYTLSDDNLFLRSLGLSTLLVSGLFLASFSAAGVLNREIENKTLSTILSKPVSRPTLIIGKFLGLITALTTAFYIGMLALLFVIRHKVMQNTTDPWDYPAIIFGLGPVFLTLLICGFGNFLYGWQVSSTVVFSITPLLTAGYMTVMVIDPKWNLQFPHLAEADLIAAIILILMLVWIISAVALAVSCKLGQVATLTVSAVVLMGGLTSDYFFGQHQVAEMPIWDQPTLAATFAWIGYRVIPNLSVFWVSDALDAGKTISGLYVLTASAYAGLFIFATLLISVAIFQRREIG